MSMYYQQPPYQMGMMPQANPYANTPLWNKLISQTKNIVTQYGKIPMSMTPQIDSLITQLCVSECAAIQAAYPESVDESIVANSAHKLAMNVIATVQRQLEAVARQQQMLIQSQGMQVPSYGQPQQMIYNQIPQQQMMPAAGGYQYQQPPVYQTPTQAAPEQSKPAPVAVQKNTTRIQTGGVKMAEPVDVITITDRKIAEKKEDSIYKNHVLTRPVVKYYTSDGGMIRTASYIVNRTADNMSDVIIGYTRNMFDHKSKNFIDQVCYMEPHVLDIPLGEFYKEYTEVYEMLTAENINISQVINIINNLSPRFKAAIEKTLVDAVNYYLRRLTHNNIDPDNYIIIENISDIADLIDLTSDVGRVEFIPYAIFYATDVIFHETTIASALDLWQIGLDTLGNGSGLFGIPCMKNLALKEMPDEFANEFTAFTESKTVIQVQRRVIFTSVYSNVPGYYNLIRENRCSTHAVYKHDEVDSKDKKWTEDDALGVILADMAYAQPTDLVVVDPKTAAVVFEGVIGIPADDTISIIAKN